MPAAGGKGAGRGRGQGTAGGGFGRGGGQGSGRGRGGGLRQGAWGLAAPTADPPPSTAPVQARVADTAPVTAEGGEVDWLRSQVAAMGRQVASLQQQLERQSAPPPAKADRRLATVDAAACTGCGRCATACPDHAINLVTMNDDSPQEGNTP